MRKICCQNSIHKKKFNDLKRKSKIQKNGLTEESAHTGAENYNKNQL